jgi:hypothetical protein
MHKVTRILSSLLLGGLVFLCGIVSTIIAAAAADPSFGRSFGKLFLAGCFAIAFAVALIFFRKTEALQMKWHAFFGLSFLILSSGIFWWLLGHAAAPGR